MTQITQEQAQSYYRAGGFFILSDLAPSSTFGIDGAAWAIGERFRGLKILPPGLHLFMASAAASSDDPEMLSAGIGVRHALLHFVKPQETIVRRWDVAGESFERPRKRVRLTATTDAEADVVSSDHLQTLDNSLAPYPFEKYQRWQRLTRFIDERCVGRVLGFDQRGDAAVDALMGALGEADGTEARTGQTTWGKPREDVVTEAPVAALADAVLRFLEFDLRRSWRAGAVGEEVSANAKDKSWLLRDVVDRRLAGEPSQLLAELQLAFILFVNVHSFSSLEAYKRLTSLVCRSTQALRASTLPLSLLTDILPVHIDLLHTDTAAHELAELDAFFAAELNTLRTNLRAVERTSEKELQTAWTALDQLSGYGLERLDAAPAQQTGKILKYDLLRSEEDSEDEEDEDKPQVVLLDETELAQLDRPPTWREEEDEVDLRL